MNTFQILTSKFRFDLMHWNVSIGPEKWPIFGRFLTLFPLNRPARREKNTSNMAATIGDVMDDVTCKSSIDNIWNKSCRKIYTIFSAVLRQLRKSDIISSLGQSARSVVYCQSGSHYWHNSHIYTIREVIR
jgi:hypothetical protein